MVENANFYVTHGFKFNATKGKIYTIRFVSYGKISKLLAMEITKSVPALDNVAESTAANSFERRTLSMIR